MQRLTVMLFIGLAGCQEQSSAPLEESGQETLNQPAPDGDAQGGDVNTDQKPLTLARHPEDVRGVKEQLEKLGAIIRVNEQDRIILVDFSFASITDAGLVHLEGLTSLRQLVLRNAPITNAGLVHLERLTSLKILVLTGTPVTDAGLVHLKGLTDLTFLALNNTRITDAGVRELKKALPKCKIDRFLSLQSQTLSMPRDRRRMARAERETWQAFRLTGFFPDLIVESPDGIVDTES